MNSQDAVARFRAQESAPTEVRNTKLAAVLSLFGHKPREKDPAIWAIDEQERPHVLWAIPKGDASKTGMSSGQVCRAWETCRGASAKLEALIAKARELTKEAAKTKEIPPPKNAAPNSEDWTDDGARFEVYEPSLDPNYRPQSKVLAELSETLEEIEALQYVSQIEAAQRGFEEHQVLMQIIKKLKESGKNQFTMERRGDKTAMFGTGMSEETIAEMKEVAKF